MMKFENKTYEIHFYRSVLKLFIRPSTKRRIHFIEIQGKLFVLSTIYIFTSLKHNYYVKSRLQKFGQRYFDLTSPKRSLKQEKRTVQLS